MVEIPGAGHEFQWIRYLKEILAMGLKKPFGQPVEAAPVVVDGSGASFDHRSKPSFLEWKLFMASFLSLALLF